MTSLENSSMSTLELKQILGRGGYYQVFASQEKALKHMGNHVLTAPECRAWAVIMPEWKATLDPREEPPLNAREALKEQLMEGDQEIAQKLYNSWLEAIKSQYKSAENLNWAECQGDVLLAFGPHAVLVVVSGMKKMEAGATRVVVTAFIPGQGQAGETQAAQRMGRLRNDTPDPSERRTRGRDMQERQLLQARRSQRMLNPDDWYFNQVFKPAVKFLRREAGVAGFTPERRYKHDYSFIYAKIQGLESWTVADWRRICGGLKTREGVGL